MEKLLLFIVLCIPSAAFADITSKFTSSVSVKVDAAMTQATRIGASYSASAAISEQVIQTIRLEV